MNPLVSIIMGSTSDWGVMEEAANFLNEMQIPFEVNALSAHRTPEKVESFSRMVQQRGIRVIIAGAGIAAHLPGVIAAYTTIPVIGVPIKSSLAGLDAMLSIIQMPPGIPVATVGINAARNAAILATQIIALSDTNIAQRLISFKESLKEKVILANEELKKINYPYKVD
jgi:5-(carboxyamino)imidazole ribonucleotide mutase